MTDAENAVDTTLDTAENKAEQAQDTVPAKVEHDEETGIKTEAIKADEGEKDEKVDEDDETEGEFDVLCCGCMQVQKGITCCNFIAMLVVSMMAIFFLVFLSAMQGFLLTSKFPEEVEEIGIGTISGYLGLADEIWSIVTLGAWGVISDKLGRRLVVCLGFAHIAIANIIIPNAATIFPGVLLARLLYAQGASALSSMLSALLADYIGRKDLGKGTGLVGLFSGFGALASVFILVGSLPQQICIKSTYYVASAIAVVFGIYAFFGLSKSNHDGESDSADDNPFLLLARGMKLAYQNREIGLAYFGGFMARGDSVIMSVFVSLWINEYFRQNELCGDVCDISDPSCNATFSTCSELLDDVEESTCPDSYTRYRIMSGVQQTVSLIAAPLLGYLGDKMNPVTLLMNVSFFSALVFLLSYYVSDPTESIALIAVILWGIASIANVIGAQVQLVKNMPSNLKGTIAGCFSLVGALGVMFFTYVGGILFDTWFMGAPWGLAGIFSTFLFAACCYVRIRNASEA